MTDLFLALDGFAVCAALGAMKVAIRYPMLLACLFGVCDAVGLLVGSAGLPSPALGAIWAGLVAVMLLGQRGTVELIDVVDRADVGMIQRGRRARFALEALERAGLQRHVFRQELEGDRAIEPRVLGLVDDAHAAAAEEFGDLVVGNPLADHGWGWRGS